MDFEGHLFHKVDPVVRIVVKPRRLHKVSELVLTVLVVLQQLHVLVHHSFHKPIGSCLEVFLHPVNHSNRQSEALGLLDALHSVLPSVQRFLA